MLCQSMVTNSVCRQINHKISILTSGIYISWKKGYQHERLHVHVPYSCLCWLYLSGSLLYTLETGWSLVMRLASMTLY